jgi:hypothetical protein
LNQSAFESPQYLPRIRNHKPLGQNLVRSPASLCRRMVYRANDSTPLKKARDIVFFAPMCRDPFDPKIHLADVIKHAATGSA